LSNLGTDIFFFRLEKLAEANRNRVILEAEADAESLRVRGEAEAYAIEAKARAEAEQMAKKADAWKDYKEAAMVDMLLDTLPKVQLSFRMARYASDLSGLDTACG
jgi:flotillin